MRTLVTGGVRSGKSRHAESLLDATAAVRAALAEAVEREPARPPRVSLEDLLAIARRSAARPEPYLTDDDLYDELGLPG